MSKLAATKRESVDRIPPACKRPSKKVGLAADHLENRKGIPKESKFLGAALIYVLASACHAFM